MPARNYQRKRILIAGTGLFLLVFSILVLFTSLNLLTTGFAFSVLLIGIGLTIVGALSGREKRNEPFSSPLMKVVLTAVFTALCLGTNYAMTSLPNVKIMDALVFIAGFMFGLDVGFGVAIMTRVVYGFFNPYGPAPFPLILFLIAGECFYAVAGVALRKWSFTGDLLKSQTPVRGMSYIFGLTGFIATFAYDALTNFATYLFLVNSLYQAFIIGMITGVPLGVLHEATNVVFFATVVPATIVASRRLGPRVSLVLSR